MPREPWEASSMPHGTSVATLPAPASLERYVPTIQSAHHTPRGTVRLNSSPGVRATGVFTFQKLPVSNSTVTLTVALWFQLWKGAGVSFLTFPYEPAG